MTMDITQVEPAQLVAWARAHEAQADRCAAARQDHPRTLAAADSWGPMFAEARRAVVETVNAREAALHNQEKAHRAMARELKIGAATMEGIGDENTRNLRLSAD